MAKSQTENRDSNLRNNRLQGGKLQPLATDIILSGCCLSALWIKSDIKKELRCITLLDGKLWRVALSWQPAATIRRPGQCALHSICLERAQERLGKPCCVLGLQWGLHRISIAARCSGRKKALRLALHILYREGTAIWTGVFQVCAVFSPLAP